jgi:two-component system, NarL family, nitrate/nitrite response regulator NarL
MPRHDVATILVGPSLLLREGLAHILRPPNFRVIASGPSINIGDAKALSRDQASLLVIEGDDSQTVVEHIAIFKERNPVSRVAVLGLRWRPSEILASFQAGANVYFPQVTTSEEFLTAIELVMLGQTLLPYELLPCLHGIINGDGRDETFQSTSGTVDHELVPNNRRGSLLSSREKGILREIKKGASNKLIARELAIAEATVKVHVKTILRKIGLSNRTQAAIWSMTQGSIHNYVQPSMTAEEPQSDEANLLNGSLLTS